MSVVPVCAQRLPGSRVRARGGWVYTSLRWRCGCVHDRCVAHTPVVYTTPPVVYTTPPSQTKRGRGGWQWVWGWISRCREFTTSPSPPPHPPPFPSMWLTPPLPTPPARTHPTPHLGALLKCGRHIRRALCLVELQVAPNPSPPQHTCTQPNTFTPHTSMHSWIAAATSGARSAWLSCRLATVARSSPSTLVRSPRCSSKTTSSVVTHPLARQQKGSPSTLVRSPRCSNKRQLVLF